MLLFSKPKDQNAKTAKTEESVSPAIRLFHASKAGANSRTLKTRPTAKILPTARQFTLTGSFACKWLHKINIDRTRA